MWIKFNAFGSDNKCTRELRVLTDKINDWITYMAFACGGGICLVMMGMFGMNIYIMFIGLIAVIIGGVGLVACGIIHERKSKKIANKYKQEIIYG